MRHVRLRFVSVLLLAVLGAGERHAFAQNSFKGKVQVVNDIRMYYEVAGEGPPLVLLHGFFGCGQYWQPLVSEFAKHYRVVTPDLRGHGHTTNPSGKFTHRQAALDVFALLDSLGIKQFKAMGFSTGGMTLLHMATQAPDRVQAMILIGASIYIPEPAREIMKGASTDNMPPEVREFNRLCLRRGDAQMRELVGTFRGAKDNYDDMSFTPPLLQTIAAPTLIVHGDRDVLFPVDIPISMYRSIPRAYLWIVPNGPHVVPIVDEMADQFQTVALRFLNGSWEEHQR